MNYPDSLPDIPGRLRKLKCVCACQYVCLWVFTLWFLVGRGLCVFLFFYVEFLLRLGNGSLETIHV